MNSSEIFNEYLNFLWTQLQYDWDIFTTPLILYTIIPALVYLLVFFIKWYIILAPITIPLTLMRPNSNDNNVQNQINELNSKIK